MLKLEATLLRGDRWAVRPVGAVGTMGWEPYAWTVIYVRARDAGDAVRKAYGRAHRQAYPLAPLSAADIAARRASVPGGA